ncbi:fluoride efflux transporter CrcB [Peribacillus sp. JNUCC 23]|uniref:fluoride efflux transporter CrcB n=1 Tax=Peribacillus sp. NPDC096379 TaxID=3364393 RepID=UPI0037FB8620
MNVLAVMIGGFLGAVCRYALGVWIPTNHGFPLGTLLINLFGCLFLGWFLTFMDQKKRIRPEFTLIIGTGFIGSFTTFSTFSVETIHLFQEGLIFLALLYVLTTTILGLLLAYLGRKLALTYKEKGDVV